MATYYISPTGNNGNAGTLLSPWKDLIYACNTATAVGDIIHVQSGNNLVSSQCALRPGVSIEGNGDSSLLTCTVNASDSWGYTGYAILARSSSIGAGNQHISNIKMTGNNYAGWGAIGIYGRNNFTVNGCTIEYFSHWGVRFGAEPSSMAGPFMTGSLFYDNVVYDCAGYYGGSLGCLGLYGLDGMLIYDSSIIQPHNRAGDNEGEPIYGVEGYIKNVKIYNNTLSKTLIVAGRWDFAIEIWSWLGGNEIYGNAITGSVDIVGARTKGSSTYSVWVHDNVISQPGYANKQSVRGVLFEGLNTDVIIERNYFDYVCEAIYMQTANWLDPPNTIYTLTQTNITIRYNMMNHIGSLVGSSGWGFYCSQENGDDPVTNFNFHNNTIIGGTNAHWGISIPDCSINSNGVYIKNNIVRGFAYAPVRMNDWSSGTTTVTTLVIQDNIFYQNGNSDNVSLAAGTVQNGYTNSGNLKTDPSFVSASDFHLTADITGVYIGPGLTDIEGNAAANPPTRGAYQFSGAPPVVVPVTAVTVTGAGNANTITVNNGTLQMYAHIDPHNATDQTVVWSVINGTGTANISATGLLTAITDGTVTVKATSNG